MDSGVAVTGIFFRAVGRGQEHAALTGSIEHGRYARAGQPTLYLSASPDGVAAAMTRHPSPWERMLLRFAVQATRIVDLRRADVLAAVRRDAGDPLADWQGIAASGGVPPSWRVRDWIAARGANGLIDPSRQQPGLWHLVLFRWNVADAPSVVPA